jgi:hypothetical protein
VVEFDDDCNKQQGQSRQWIMDLGFFNSK